MSASSDPTRGLQASPETAATLPPTHPLQPEPIYPALDLSSLGAPEELKADPLPALNDDNATDLVLPDIVLGCAVFGLGIYNDEKSILSNLPVNLVRLALRYGINAFDTAPHYHPSEIILARALGALKEDYPRSSYKLITKAGKFGPRLPDHDYSPTNITGTIERSLQRFSHLHDGEKPYLDVVYLHDVEFIATHPNPAGFPLEALNPETAAKYDLGSLHNPNFKQRSLGQGDDQILAAVDTLRQYQLRGQIRKIGIAGYSLPLLLRLSLLVLHESGQPLDIVQSYGHHNLLNSTLPEFLPYFTDRAQVRHIANASPFNMGLLTTSGPPDWHPASDNVKQAVRDVVADLKDGPVKIEDLASRFGMRELRSEFDKVPVVIGAKDVDELHHAMATYHTVRTGQGDDQKELEAKVRQTFRDKGVADWSWQSPPADAY